MKNFKNPDPIKTNNPSECLAYMNNIKRLGTQELWRQYFQRYCELKASEHETDSTLLKQYYKFLYAYEQALAEKHQGKRRPQARRIRNAIKDRMDKNNGNSELAVIDYLTMAVTKKGTTDGFEFLMCTDQTELTAEHLVKSNRSYFSEATVAAATKKLDNWAPSIASADIQQKIKNDWDR
ncbi:hypothetical protein N9N21_01710 [Alphaproteobacteria bacterium]|nr:hypothetical protein [Alphaproteobacteria bacterium]